MDPKVKMILTDPPTVLMLGGAIAFVIGFAWHNK